MGAVRGCDGDHILFFYDSGPVGLFVVSSRRGRGRK